MSDLNKLMMLCILFDLHEEVNGEETCSKQVSHTRTKAKVKSDTFRQSHGITCKNIVRTQPNNKCKTFKTRK